MTDKPQTRKGIHDPWRLGTDAWRPPADEEVPGTAQSSEALDWDLQPDKKYVFRVPGAALKVIGVDTPEDAARHILQVYQRDTQTHQVLRAAGFTDQLAQSDVRGFVLRTNNGVLCCPAATSSIDGFQRLNNALRRAIRQDATFQQHLKTMGLIPITI